MQKRRKTGEILGWSMHRVRIKYILMPGARYLCRSARMWGRKTQEKDGMRETRERKRGGIEEDEKKINRKKNEPSRTP